MGIAEKKQQASNNNDYIKTIADGIYDNGYWAGVAWGEVKGIEQGEKKEQDRFWDAYQENGNRTDYDHAFTGSAWTDETYGKIKYGFGRPTVVSAIFRYNAHVTDTVKEIDFYNVGTISTTFDNAKALKKIRCLKVVSWNTFGSTVFQNCVALEEIEFSGELARSGLDLHWSTKLTRESIISVINVLSSTTSGLTVTLPKTAVDNAFDGGSTGYDWLNLIATKSNWTISLA